MVLLCVRCLSPAYKTLCRPCMSGHTDNDYGVDDVPIHSYAASDRQGLAAPILKPRLQIATLYRYDDPVRRCLHQIKISNNTPYLMGLLRLLAQSPRVAALLRVVDTIVPAPPSLWGRIRGRYDIAQAVAQTLAQRFNKQLVEFPLTMSLNLKKRAGHNHTHAKAAPVISHWPKQDLLRGRRVLFLDDIITTGTTFRRYEGLIAAAEPRSVQAIFIAEVQGWSRHYNASASSNNIKRSN
jgi:predicted amidophosphoribosyltransferase